MKESSPCKNKYQVDRLGSVIEVHFSWIIKKMFQYGLRIDRGELVYGAVEGGTRSAFPPYFRKPRENDKTRL